MKILAIDTPNSLDINSRATVYCWLNVIAFLLLADLKTKANQRIQKMARLLPKSYDLNAIKRQRKYEGLTWENLDRLAEQIHIEEPIHELIARVGK